jgi:hypothetical protein
LEPLRRAWFLSCFNPQYSPLHRIHNFRFSVSLLFKPYAMKNLTAKDEDICSYLGLFGTLISATCLIQHFIISHPQPITMAIAIIYVFSGISYILLAYHRPPAPVMMIITIVLTLFAELVLLKYRLFSAIVLLLCLYAIGTTIYVYVEELPGRMAQKAALKRIERQEWAGKI